MPKRTRESDVERETMEELVEKVQSQATTIRDLEDKLQSQFAIYTELKGLYNSRYEGLEQRYRTCFTFWLQLSDEYCRPKVRWKINGVSVRTKRQVQVASITPK